MEITDAANHGEASHITMDIMTTISEEETSSTAIKHYSQRTNRENAKKMLKSPGSCSIESCQQKQLNIPKWRFLQSTKAAAIFYIDVIDTISINDNY